MKVNFNNKLFHYFLLLIIALSIFYRVFHLDRDIPRYSISGFYPNDELYYAHKAYRDVFDRKDFLNNYGENIKSIYENDFNKRVNLGYLFSIFSFKIFGNNYYGLRMASVFAFLISCFFFYKLLEIDKSSFISIVIFLYFLFDFQLYLTSSTYENSIFRIFAILLLFFFYKKMLPKENYAVYLFLGVLSGIVVFWVYLLNFFLIPAVLIAKILSDKNNNIKTVFLKTSNYFLGLMVFLFFYYLYLYSKDSGLFILMGDYLKYSDRVNISGNLIFFAKNSLRNIFFISKALFIKNNPIIFALIIVLLPFSLKRFIRRTTKNKMLLLYYSFFTFGFIQMIFTNRYAERKLIIFFPIILLIFNEMLRVFMNKDQIKREKPLHISYFFYYIIVVIILHMTYVQENKHELQFLISSIMLVIFLVSFVASFLFYKSKVIIIIKISLIIGLVFNLFLWGYYILLNPVYNCKDMLIDMRNYTDNEMVINGIQSSLYNSSRGILNRYRYIDDKNEYKRVFLDLVKDKKIKYGIQIMINGKPYTPFNEFYLGNSLDKYGFALLKEYRPYNNYKLISLRLYKKCTKKN